MLLFMMNIISFSLLPSLLNITPKYLQAMYIKRFKFILATCYRNFLFCSYTYPYFIKRLKMKPVS